MTRDEWIQVLDSEPATPNQRGALMRECERLGLTGRAERLAVLAGLLGADELDTTGDLTMGQAGQLVGILHRAGGLAELPDVARVDGHQGDEHGGQMSIAEAVLTIAALICAAWHGNHSGNGPANVGIKVDQPASKGTLPVTEGRPISTST